MPKRLNYVDSSSDMKLKFKRLSMKAVNLEIYADIESPLTIDGKRCLGYRMYTDGGSDVFISTK